MKNMVLCCKDSLDAALRAPDTLCYHDSCLFSWQERNQSHSSFLVVHSQLPCILLDVFSELLTSCQFLAVTSRATNSFEYCWANDFMAYDVSQALRDCLETR